MSKSIEALIARIDSLSDRMENAECSNPEEAQALVNSLESKVDELEDLYKQEGVIKDD
jgi:transcription elongation GreA/GreB family factor